MNKSHEKVNIALLKCVHWMCTEDIALSFSSLVDLLHDLGVEDLALFRKGSKINYESSKSVTDLLDALSDVVEEDLKETLEKYPVVTALADESTDITNHKVSCLRSSCK